MTDKKYNKKEEVAPKEPAVEDIYPTEVTTPCFEEAATSGDVVEKPVVVSKSLVAPTVEDWFRDNAAWIAQAHNSHQIIMKFCQDFGAPHVLPSDLTTLDPLSDPYRICKKLILKVR